MGIALPRTTASLVKSSGSNQDQKHILTRLAWSASSKNESNHSRFLNKTIWQRMQQKGTQEQAAVRASNNTYSIQIAITHLGHWIQHGRHH
jgi:hypothetical protein